MLLLLPMLLLLSILIGYVIQRATSHEAAEAAAAESELTVQRANGLKLVPGFARRFLAVRRVSRIAIGFAFSIEIP
jgi:hypothetical protein